MGEAVGSFVGGLNGGVLVAGVAAAVAVGTTVSGCELGVGVDTHAQSVSTSAADVSRIFRLPLGADVFAVGTEPSRRG